MDINTPDEKKRLIEKHTPSTRVGKNCMLAFIFGGGLCLAAEGERQILLAFGMDSKTALTTVSLTFITLAAVATAFGVFDRIARHAGAGTLVPITGFSNSVVSEAMDSASEGYILGVGAKIFTVAGPVILYGISSGIVYGIIYFAISSII